MDVHGGFEVTEDATLVAAAVGGDRAAFAQIYDRYADRLHDYCWSLLRDREEAADATHDTFVLAAERLGQLRDPARLKAWLYAVARSQALRRLRLRDRVIEADGEREMETVADPGSGPEGAAEQADLRRLVWDAVAGLGERDRSLLDLHLRQGLEGTDLGEAMGVSANHAYVLLSRVRDQVERALGALLVARMGREDCAELEVLLAEWDGRFSPLIRKRVARHVDGCEVCGERRRTMVSPLALLAGVPPMAAPAGLRDRVLASVRLRSGGPGDGGGLDALGLGGPEPEPEVPSGRSRWSRAGVLSLAVLLALLVGGVGAVLLPERGSGGDAALEAAPPTLPPPSLGPGLPSSLPPASPTPTPASTTTTTAAGTTVTTAPATATTAPSPRTTATTLPGGVTSTVVVPVELVVNPPELRISPRSQGTITIFNPNRFAVAWEAVASDLWIEITPTGGTLGPGQRTVIDVTLGPIGIGQPAEGSVLVTWDGGQARVVVRPVSPEVTIGTRPPPSPLSRRQR